MATPRYALIISEDHAGVGYSFLFFFNDTATTEIYTLSLHDALPISAQEGDRHEHRAQHQHDRHHRARDLAHGLDRKSTRLNSSHLVISYAVFCLKKKKSTNCRAPMVTRTC